MKETATCCLSLTSVLHLNSIDHLLIHTGEIIKIRQCLLAPENLHSRAEFIHLGPLGGDPNAGSDSQYPGHLQPESIRVFSGLAMKVALLPLEFMQLELQSDF